MRYLKKNTRPGFIPLSVFCFIIVMGLGRYAWTITNPSFLPIEALNASSRMINSIFTTVITAMALIITLASNLYTPGLVKVFVRHPVVVVGMSLIVGTNICLVLGSMFPQEHIYYKLILEVSYILSCFSMASIMPFLYYISQFLRPSYFLPLVRRNAQAGLDSLEESHLSIKTYNQLFDNINVISNVFLTASRRDDRQLMRLAMNMLHEILMSILKSYSEGSNEWRNQNQRFNSGLFDEGKSYLKRNNSWPEAFIFGKYIQLLKGMDSHQDEVVAEVCENLQSSLLESIQGDRVDIVEMHLMCLNFFTRISIEQKNAFRLESLCYNFRLMIQKLSNHPKKQEAAFSSWYHYSRLGDFNNVAFGYETFIYESGLMLLEATETNIDVAISLYEKHVKTFWNNSVLDGAKHETVAIRAAIHTYWEALSSGESQLSSLIYDDFLTNEDIHRNTLENMLSFNTPLHWELTDRLLRFTYLNPNAEKKAREFLLIEEKVS